MNNEKRDKIIAMMKQVLMIELPRCSFCEKPAAVDGPTLTGQWAYMCRDCVCDRSDIMSVAHVGTRLSLKPPKTEQTDKRIYPVVEATPLDKLMFDDRIVVCPVCRHEHTMEADADGNFDCHKCGRRLSLEARI